MNLFVIISYIKPAIEVYFRRIMFEKGQSLLDKDEIGSEHF